MLTLFVDGSHDFGYGHLFWGSQSQTQSGGCYLKRMAAPNSNRWAIVLIVDGDTTAIGPNMGNVSFGGKTFSVKDSVNAGSPIGPTGGSSSGNELGPHLHLYSNSNGSSSIADSNTKNPLQYVDYADTSFNVGFLKRNDIDTGITLVYPGNLVTTIQVRPKLEGQAMNVKRYQKVLDLDKLEIFIKPANDTFQLIKGPWYESKIYLGGELNGPNRYPRTTSTFYNTENQWGRTGIHPYAYRGDKDSNNTSKADPWDDYYYADFVTRIHKDDPYDKGTTPTLITSCPMDARYNDGKIKFFSKVSDISNNIDYSDTLSYILDNFRPFIQQVTIRSGIVPIYDRYWECESTCNGIRFVDGLGGVPGTISYTSLSEEIEVTVYASEPLDSLTMGIPLWNINDRMPSSVSPDRIRFTFTVDTSEIEVSGDVRFYFDGFDCSGNDLIQFKHQQEVAPCVQIPTQNATGWDHITNFSFGSDDTHTFTFECDGPIQPPAPPGGPVEPAVVLISGGDCFNTGFSWEVTEATGPSFSDGSIDLDIDTTGLLLPLSYSWSTNETTEDISGLSPGDYTVTVQDALCCYLVQNFTVGDNCPSYLIFGSNSTDACPGANDGSLEVITIFTIFGDQSYSYYWSTGETTKQIVGLNPGVYRVTVVNDRGCSESQSFSIEEKSIQLNTNISNPCSDTDGNGSISLSPSGGRRPYSYAWGFTTTNSGYVDNLIPGDYCVTVEDADGCSMSECFSLSPKLDVAIVDFKMNNLCRGYREICKGSISAIATSNRGHTYQWTSNNGFSSTSNTITNLCNGNYNLIVTDIEGCTVSKWVKICCCEMEDNLEPGGEPGHINFDLCNPESQHHSLDLEIYQSFVSSSFGGSHGSVDIEVRGGKGYGYVYNWSGPNGFVSYEQDISGLESGPYYITVTDGCDQIETWFIVQDLECESDQSSQVLSDIFVTEKTKVCPGTSNGTARLTIPNPNDDLIKVFLNGLQVPIAQQGNPTEVLFTGLKAGELNRYDVRIEIGDCIYVFDFVLEEDIFTPTYVSHEQREGIYTCKFRNYCDGEYYGESERIGYYDHHGASTRPCEVSIYCGNTKIGKKKESRKKIKAYEYYLNVEAAYINGLITVDYYQLLIDRYTDKGIEPCDKVRWCPASLAFTAHDPPFLRSGAGLVTTEDGCTKVECDGFGVSDFKICDYKVAGLQGASLDLLQCAPRKYNVWQLLLAYQNGYLNTIPGFTGKPLENFLRELVEEPREEYRCAYIIFCTSDFSILGHNIDRVNCGNLDVVYQINRPDGSTAFVSKGCENVIVNNDQIVVACNNNGLPVFHVVDENFSGPLKNSLEDKPIKIVQDNIGNEEVIDLAYIRSDSVVLPQPLVRADSNKSYFYNYAHKATNIDKSVWPGVIKFVSDWDHERSIYIEKQDTISNNIAIDENTYKLTFEDSVFSWTYDIFSDDLNISLLKLTDDKVFIGGVFNGGLVVDGVSLKNVNNSTLFLISMNFDGSLISQNFIENIDPDNFFIQDRNNNEFSIVSKYMDNWFKANNGIQTMMDDSAGIVIFDIDVSGQFAFRNHMRGVANMSLLDLSNSKTNMDIAVLLNGVGEIELDGDIVCNSGSSTNFTYLLSIDEDGELNWCEAIDNQNLEVDKLALDYGSDGNELFLGLTYNGSTSVFGELLNSNGSSDVAIVKIDELGNKRWIKDYGTIDYECIEDVYYTNNCLMFTGRFAGDTRYREIGAYGFLNTSPSLTKVYQSFVLTTADTTPVEKLVDDKDIILDSESIDELSADFIISPNPTYDDQFNILSVGKLESNKHVFEVYDMSGRKIYDDFVEGNIIKHTIKFDSGSGVFVLKVKTLDGKNIFTERIVKIK